MGIRVLVKLTLRWGHYPGLSQSNQCNPKGPYKLWKMEAEEESEMAV